MTITHEVITSNTVRPKCDGGGGALGHPLIYLKADSNNKAECPYCGRIFDCTSAHDDNHH